MEYNINSQLWIPSGIVKIVSYIYMSICLKVTSSEIAEQIFLWY